MGVVVRRFDVFLIALDPTIGREIRKTRPCLVVSPDEMNRHLATILVAPMTTGGQLYPTRVPCRFRGTASLRLPQSKNAKRNTSPAYFQ
jgi:mRNA interferase MazF